MLSVFILNSGAITPFTDEAGKAEREGVKLFGLFCRIGCKRFICGPTLLIGCTLTETGNPDSICWEKAKLLNTIPAITVPQINRKCFIIDSLF
jgi:hypothetical protein